VHGERDALDCRALEHVEELAVEPQLVPRVEALDVLAPELALVRQQHVVEDQLVGAHRQRLARHGRVDELVQPREAMVPLEHRDRVPTVLGDEPIGVRLPIEVAELVPARVTREVVRHEVVVGDRVGGEVREIAEHERLFRLRTRELQHRLDDRPAMAVVVVTAERLEVDDVRRDVAVLPGRALGFDQIGDPGGEELAPPPEDARLELEVVAGPPRAEREARHEQERGDEEHRPLSRTPRVGCQPPQSGLLRRATNFARDSFVKTGAWTPRRARVPMSAA
jgi:hypothetical protein